MRSASIERNQLAELPEQDRLLTRKEAAEYLGLQPQSMAVWALTGRYDLPFIKVGRVVRYRLSDLHRWLESRTRQNTRQS